MDEVTVDGLRVMFRGLSVWRDLFERFGVELQTVSDEHGTEWDLFEVEKLFIVSQQRLTARQAQAIRYFLVGNMREEDVAVAMGIKRSNPIGLYATEGLRRLVILVEEQNGNLTGV
jgi:hypothetical protein